MQGQRGAIGSLSETLDFDHGSTSTSSSVDHQIYWNNMGGPAASTNAAIDPQILWSNAPSPAENQIPNYVILPNDLETSYRSSIGQQWPSLGGWSFGESSSSDSQNEVDHNEQKARIGWSSSVRVSAGSHPRLQERCYERSDPMSLDSINRSPLFIHNSSSDGVPQNLNLNAGFVVEDGGNNQGLEHPHMHKSNGLVNEQSLSNISSGSLILPSGSNGFLGEDNDSRSGRALEARRLSCKRKTVEGIPGQSSAGGSSGQSQYIENGAGPGILTEGRYGNRSTVSAPQEQVHARFGLIVREADTNNRPESSGGMRSTHRNFRLRINPSNLQNSIPPAALPSGSARHSSSSSSRTLPRFIPIGHSPDLSSADTVDSLVSQSEQVVFQVPPLPQNSRWNRGSSSRTGQLSNTSTVVSVGRDALQLVDMSSRGIARNISEHPMFIPASDLQNLGQNPADRMSLVRNISVPGIVASSSLTGVSPASHPPSSTWVSRPNPPQYPRRLTEYVRRSLFSAGSETGGQSSNNSTSRTGATAMSQGRPPSGAGSLGHHRSRLRSSPWIDMQGDGDFGIPYSLRALTTASQGSTRLVSEQIRNVIGLMRRGENLRLEDVMVLEHSVFSGMADLHDLHRDMRLDVDNMSYEELLALEERIGNVSTGLSDETISNRLKHKYFVSGESQTEAEPPCCICQEEYSDGEDIGTLDCGHYFHSNCIKQWLMHKNLCPICKTAGLAT